jgi:hypothetical protein
MRKHIEQNFSPHKMVSDELAAYRELLRTGK